jgi:hypothetical protein
MKKLEDISVSFIWEGREVTAWGDCEYETHKVDVGPWGYREHVMAEVPYELFISKCNLAHGDKDITEPEEDLLEFAKELLMEEANEQLCQEV